MNITLQSRVYRVSRGSFVNDKTGEVINYAKVYVLQSTKDSTDDIGLDIQSISCDASMFDELVKFHRENTKVNFEIELKPNNGLLKPKVVSLTPIK